MNTVKLEVKQEVNDSGQLKCEEYSLNGKYHNEHGPAIRSWYGSGELWREQYRLNGELLTKDEWQRRVKPDPCLGKVVTVDGRQYKLEAVQ